MRRSNSRSGLTLIEVLIGTTILFILMGSLTRSLTSLKGVTTAGDTNGRLQEAGERILKTISDDMKRSGFVTIGAKDYPFLFNEGDANSNWQGTPTNGFAAHNHAAPNHAAGPGEIDFGVTRELVFTLPQDADENGVPDVDAAGALAWDAREFSYVLVTRPDGINYLERRADGGAIQKVGMFVERVAFDTNETTLLEPNPVPLGAVRIQVFLRQQDEVGLVHRYTARAVVRMRNGTV